MIYWDDDRRQKYLDGSGFDSRAEERADLRLLLEASPSLEGDSIPRSVWSRDGDGSGGIDVSHS